MTDLQIRKWVVCIAMGVAVNPTAVLGCDQLQDPCAAVLAVDAPCAVDYPVLAVRPSFFDGKRIVTFGFLVPIGSNWLLYPDMARARAGFLPSATVISDAQVLTTLRNKGSKEGEYVELIGIFSRQSTEKRIGTYLGYFHSVDKLTLLEQREGVFQLRANEIYRHPNW